MEVNNTRINPSTGIAAGIGAGLIADKAIRMNPYKAWTNFITNKQAGFVLKQTAKDVFQINTNKNIIEKANGALINSDGIAKASKKGLENLAKRFNLAFNESSTSQTILSELQSKTDDAMTLFAKKCKTMRTFNFVALGAIAFGLATAVINKFSNKTEKV